MQARIIGTGNMARGIATRLRAGGHEVMLLGSEAGKGEELARALDGSVSSGTIEDTIAGDIVALAVPYEATKPVVRQYGEDLRQGLVDINKPRGLADLRRSRNPPRQLCRRRDPEGGARG